MPKAIKVLVTVFWKILKLWQTLYLTACSVNFLKSVMHETLASFQFLSEMSPSLVISTMPVWYSLLANVELELRLYVSKSQISTSEWRSGRSRTHPLHKQLKSRKRMHETVLCGWTITAGNLESWRKGNKSWDDDDPAFCQPEVSRNRDRNLSQCDWHQVPNRMELCRGTVHGPHYSVLDEPAPV